MTERSNSDPTEPLDISGKVLYVCRANRGRSQVAEALHNHYLPDTADSAGTQADEVDAEFLGDWEGAAVVINAMRKRNLDISANTSRQIDREQAMRYGKVIIMAELNARPLYLLGFDNAVLWDIPDLKDKDIEEADKIIDDIDKRVRTVVIEMSRPA